MSNTIERLDPARFAYTRFHSDLLAKAASRGLTMARISTDMLYRGESYLSNCLASKAIPVRMFFALCEEFGLSAKDYEIKPEHPKPAPKQTPAHACSVLSSGWDSVVHVNEDARTVSIRIFHDGSQVTSAMAKLRGDSDLDVVQSISYAAHMCYKFAEQKTLGAQIGG